MAFSCFSSTSNWALCKTWLILSSKSLSDTIKTERLISGRPCKRQSNAPIREAGTRRSQANQPLILDASVCLFWFCHMTVVETTSYSVGQESRKPCILMAWQGAGSPMPSLVHIIWFLGQSLLAAVAPKNSLFVLRRSFILKHKSSLTVICSSAPFILLWARQNGGPGAVFPLYMFCLFLKCSDLCQSTGTILPVFYMPCPAGLTMVAQLQVIMK